MSKRLQGEEMRRAVSISLIYAIASFIVLQPIPLNAVEKEVNVQIAYQGPLSGPESPLGQSELEAVKYAVSSFNDFYQEQIKVELQTIDDQGDPSVAIKVAPKAAADSCLAPSQALSSSSSFQTARIPLPPPPAVALSITG